MKNKQWMLRAVGVISALALGLGGLAACGNSSSAESKNGRVYYLNKKAEEQSTWVKLGKAFEKETREGNRHSGSDSDRRHRLRCDVAFGAFQEGRSYDVPG